MLFLSSLYFGDHITEYGMLLHVGDDSADHRLVQDQLGPVLLLLRIALPKLILVQSPVRHRHCILTYIKLVVVDIDECALPAVLLHVVKRTDEFDL